MTNKLVMMTAIRKRAPQPRRLEKNIVNGVLRWNSLRSLDGGVERSKVTKEESKINITANITIHTKTAAILYGSGIT